MFNKIQVLSTIRYFSRQGALLEVAKKRKEEDEEKKAKGKNTSRFLIFPVYLRKYIYLKKTTE